jgi:hypothetical protein
MALVVEPHVERGPDGTTVRFHWSGTEGEKIDRPCTYGISVGMPGPKSEALAKRLCAAARAQKLFEVHGIAQSQSGSTYVDASVRVLGRHLNADLRKLGF